MTGDDADRAGDLGDATNRVGWAGDVRAWIAEHPLRTIGAITILLALTRLAAVSRFDPTTMTALLQESSFAVIATGLIILLWYVTACVAAAVWYTAALDLPIPRRRWAMLATALAPFVATAAIAVFVDATLGLLVSFAVATGMWFTLIRRIVRRTRARRAADEPRRPRDLDWALEWLVLASMTVALATIGGAAVLGALGTPWHRRETIVMLDEVRYDGYVLEDDGRWMTVLLHDGRDIATIEIAEIDERVPHDRGDGSDD